MRDTDNKRLVDGGILARVLATSPNQVRRLEKEGAIPQFSARLDKVYANIQMSRLDLKYAGLQS